MCVCYNEGWSLIVFTIVRVMGKDIFFLLWKTNVHFQLLLSPILAYLAREGRTVKDNVICTTELQISGVRGRRITGVYWLLSKAQVQ